MRLAVFSDVHGNWTALEAVLADMDAIGGFDIVWCLGDLSAYGSRPAECLRRIRERREAFGKDKFHVIGGNTDRYLITGERFPAKPAQDANELQLLVDNWQPRDTALNWTAAQLSFEDYQWLQKRLGRETFLEAPGYGWVIGYHAIPGNDETILLPGTPDEEARDMLLDREGNLAIGGHIHVQMNRELGSWRVVNVGSVGQSTDMPGKAQWGLFTFENGDVTIDLRAIPYDVEAAIADYHAVGHPAAEWVASKLRPVPK
jgi:predicted phosphodiesterase